MGLRRDQSYKSNNSKFHCLSNKLQDLLDPIVKVARFELRECLFIKVTRLNITKMML